MADLQRHILISDLSFLMIYHDVMGLHISVHDSLAVTEVKSLPRFSQSSGPLDGLANPYLEELIDVVPNIVVHKLWI